MKKIITLLLMLATAVSSTFAYTSEDRLYRMIRLFLSNFDARIGVAVIINSTDTVAINDDHCYPLASVVKFPQAMAALDYMEHNGIPLDSIIRVDPDDLHEDTYSPIRQLYPYGTNLSFAELLDFSLVQSDNNACDKIFNTLVSPYDVQEYVAHKLGICNIHISQTEADMHHDICNTYRNCASPTAIAALFDRLYSQKLFSDSSLSFLRRALIACSTGKNQLRQPLEGTKAVIGHKTGSGAVNQHQRVIATNDAGFIDLPDGRHYTIAVFVENSAEDNTTNANIIAGVSAIVYRYLTRKQVADRPTWPIPTDSIKAQ